MCAEYKANLRGTRILHLLYNSVLSAYQAPMLCKRCHRQTVLVSQGQMTERLLMLLKQEQALTYFAECIQGSGQAS